MNSTRFILESLRHYWRVHLAVALGVVAGTAVLTGALLIGDSVRGSLRQLTLERLGPVDEALVAGGFFRTALAEELTQHAAEGRTSPVQSLALPAIVLEVSLEKPLDADPDRAPRAGKVSLYGCDERFFTAWGDAELTPKGDEIVLTVPLAEALEAKVGDEVLVRVPEISDVPRESALGKKSDTVSARRLKVSRVIPATGIGRFSLTPNQQTPRNAFVSLRQLQVALGQYDRREKRDRVNAVFVTGLPAPDLASLQGPRWIDDFRPPLADYGLSLSLLRIPASDGAKGKDAQDPPGPAYLNLASRHLLLDSTVLKAAAEAFPKARLQPVLTYLANTVAAGERSFPYSTITAIDFSAEPPLGPFVDPAGQPIPPLAADEIALSSWAAEDLEAKLGDEITVTYFKAESTHGQPVEETAKFRLQAIVAMTGPGVDPRLTPDFPGITDKLKIGEWDPPFPYDSSRIRGKDDNYWEEYRATPKAYVSLAAGQKLWGSRFGNVTTLRIAPEDAAALEPDAVEKARVRLASLIDPAAMGLVLRPVKAEGLAAASGSTPFDLLFLGFSFFIIAAAVMLVALLFRLGVEGRAREVGTLLAEGLRQSLVRQLLTREGLVVAAVGGVFGTALGIGYAWLMLAALRSPNWWLAAVGVPFLNLHVHWLTLTLGYVCGVLVSYLAIWFSVRRLGQFSVRQLVAGAADEPDVTGVKPPRYAGWVALFAAVAAAPLIGLGWNLSGEAQAGAFFGAGALSLTALLAGLLARLKQPSSRRPALIGRGALPRLALRNAARNPSRSVLTIGLVAAATFLIVAISAFRIDPANMRPTLHSGNGGFSLVAQSDQPLFYDLNTYNTAAGRNDLALTEADAQALAGMRVFAARFRPGDDASCRNLYQTNPGALQILGVPQGFIDRGGFAWAGSLAATEEERKNPWLLLAGPGKTDPIPVVLDAATAQYSLKVGLGSELASQDDAGRPVKLKVVGLLQNSLLQGIVVVGEKAFLNYWPRQSGYRFFLIETPPERTAEIARELERLPSLSALGFSTERASDRLAGFLAVQNTYLSTFQSLGGLGLLLGTFGLAVVQLRSVLERRGELALLRATGLRRSTLAWLVLCENAGLLFGGLAAGVLAALAAVLPHLAAGGASLPWQTLGWMLGLVAGVGLLASLASVRAALSAPLLPALKGN